jgi:hypothetical protein
LKWDERVPVHVASDFYDQEPLRRGQGVLDPIAKAAIERLHPGGLAGLRVLHLQCHFGSHTLSLANLGANVVGSGRLYFADGHPAAYVFDGADGLGGMPTFQ